MSFNITFEGIENFPLIVKKIACSDGSSKSFVKYGMIMSIDWSFENKYFVFESFFMFNLGLLSMIMGM